MCGGTGDRLDADVEKPLYPVASEPMIDRVRRALDKTDIESTYAVVSPNAPETRAHLDGETPCIETPGDGYVADLGRALDDPQIEPPVLTVAADLALLTADTVDDVRRAYRQRVRARARSEPEAGETRSGNHDSPSMTVCVPREVKRRLGVSVEETSVGADTLVPTGLNVVGSGGDGDQRGADDGDPPAPLVHVVRTADAAINVNRLEDAAIADRLATRHR
nr:NTP transferase domain-containing protein [Halovivax cerinus]